MKKDKSRALFWNYYTSNNENIDDELKDLIREYPTQKYIGFIKTGNGYLSLSDQDKAMYYKYLGSSNNLDVIYNINEMLVKSQQIKNYKRYRYLF